MSAAAASFEFSFPRYLESKRTVDNRALSRAVWGRFVGEIFGPQGGGRLRRLLEIGGGTGALLRRVMALPGINAHYTVVEIDGEALAAGREGLMAWARGEGWSVCPFDETLVLFENRHEMKRVEVEFHQVDILDWIAARPANAPRVHGLMGQAVLDLFDVDAVLPRWLELLEPGWFFYFPITFDGETALEPATSDPEDDTLAIRLYHESMDQRRIAGRLSGDSRAGRHFFAQARRAGAEILAAESSDWIVYAGAGGAYPAEEAYFIRCILHYLESELAKRSDVFPPDRLARWMAERHAQLDRGELVYIAHQFDFLGRRPA
ncbi:MAG: hypothetical protein RLY93_14945 [Sumerlaeia bacterium]